MFTKKYKKQIQTLEARVRGLIEENQQLQASELEAKMQVYSLKRVVIKYKNQLPERNEKGQFIKKGSN